MTPAPSHYYVPGLSPWPLLGSIGLFALVLGFALALNDFSGIGGFFIGIGLLIFLGNLCGWFATVIRESRADRYNDQVDASFRWGMAWFIPI